VHLNLWDLQHYNVYSAISILPFSPAEISKITLGGTTFSNLFSLAEFIGYQVKKTDEERTNIIRYLYNAYTHLGTNFNLPMQFAPCAAGINN